MGIIGITGADGFIGRNLCSYLEQRSRQVARIVRQQDGPGHDRRTVGSLESCTALHERLDGIDVLVHLAGRAHILREKTADPREEFRRANIDATKRLADAAIAAGVRRFVFVSSVGVNGNETRELPFTECDLPAPVEAYARSKLEAEQWLQAHCHGSGMELIVVRPPLVYGPGAPGNFGRLVTLAASGLPLPLAGVVNQRSMIGVTNLASFLTLCAEHPRAPGETFLIAEPEPYSTPQLLRLLAAALGKPSRMFRVPSGLLRMLASAAGRRREFDKLCGSLVVSTEKVRVLLGWSPLISINEELDRIAAWYRDRAARV